MTSPAQPPTPPVKTPGRVPDEQSPPSPASGEPGPADRARLVARLPRHIRKEHAMTMSTEPEILELLAQDPDRRVRRLARRHPRVPLKYATIGNLRDIAENPETHPRVLGSLLGHPDRKVRENARANLSTIPDSSDPEAFGRVARLPLEPDGRTAATFGVLGPWWTVTTAVAAGVVLGHYLQRVVAGPTVADLAAGLWETIVELLPF